MTKLVSSRLLIRITNEVLIRYFLHRLLVLSFQINTFFEDNLEKYDNFRTNAYVPQLGSFPRLDDIFPV